MSTPHGRDPADSRLNHRYKPSSRRPTRGGVHIYINILMLHINLICLGKLKESFWRDAETEYLKRLQPFAKIKIIELREESFDEKNNPETIKQKEAEKILKSIPENSFVIALDSTGKQFTSPQLAQQLLNNPTIQQTNNITFIIGGPLGLDASILKTTQLKLSFSLFWAI